MTVDQEQNQGKNDQSVAEPQGGIRLDRVDPPEMFRYYILDPERIPKTTLAERMAGISETPLGEFNLDGGLFSSVRFSLIVEADDDKQQKRPTAIIRADLKLGDHPSSLHRLHEDGAKGEGYADVFFSEFGVNLNPNPPYLLGEEISFTQWSRNTARMSPPFKPRMNLNRTPLTLLQVWDKDMGFGFISISLVSWGRYRGEWMKNYDSFSKNRENQWETDENDVDRWKFSERVGIDVSDAERFKRSLEFFIGSFYSAMQAIYKLEGINAPDLPLRLEVPPINLREDETVTFDDIGGQEGAVSYLRGVTQDEKRQKQVSQLQQPILLYGQPGNGKTSLAKAFASELGIDPVTKEPSDLPAQSRGDDIIRFLESAYLEAKSKAARSGSKSILFLEQLDSILGNDTRVHDSFIGLMERWQREREVILIATSNLVAFHPAILSRFDDIHVPAPDVFGKEDILRKQAAKIGKIVGRDVFGEVDFSLIAKEVSDFSGRDMVKLLSIVYRQHRLVAQSFRSQTPISTEFILDLIPKLVPQVRKFGFNKP